MVAYAVRRPRTTRYYLPAGPGPRMQRPRATSRLGAAALAAQSAGSLPLAVDLVLYRGDDFYLDVAVTDAGGAPFDLTGYTAAAQIRATPDTADPPAATFTATITGSTVQLHLPSDESGGVPAVAAWDVQITKAGIVTTLAFGAVATTLDVTRP